MLYAVNERCVLYLINDAQEIYMNRIKIKGLASAIALTTTLLFFAPTTMIKSVWPARLLTASWRFWVA